MTGIYIEYHDHLSCDAFRVWAYRNGENLLNENIFNLLTKNRYYKEDMEMDVYRFKGIEVSMIGDCAYYGTTGLKTTVEVLKKEFPDLQVKCFKKGWYTFPQEYREVGNYFLECLPLEVEMIEGNMSELENSQK